MPDNISMHTPMLHQLVPSHVGAYGGPPQGTPEQHFANHLQDHYGMQMQNYNQHDLSHHAQHFALQHCGGHNDPMAALLQLVHDLKAEVSFLKHGAPSAPGAPAHETLLQAQDRITQQEVATKAHLRANEEKLAVAELETKMAKKMRDSILQSI